ncbi:HAMP domain-containing sensor histidine kinase [Clostridium sp. D53t1_180928_C8]|uniref:sensor histidine kinase n=1 Tax=Clostridium sp. D53t1_180928_C8 TaxID=2787101 RepID=UPI0018ABAD1C|nr:HAMP domain-containing sensor histidine kinase [Clostridium sp. D53t1_180928_C8]
MMSKIIDEGSLEKKEKNLLIYIVFITIGIVIFEFFYIFRNKNMDISYLQSTILFIKFFNSTLSLLAFGSCIVLYIRLKRESIFIISLMYLSITIGIIAGYFDKINCINETLLFTQYTNLLSSFLKFIIISISILPDNKFKNIIVNNKIKSVLACILITTTCGFLDNKFIIINPKENTWFIIYNLFLIISYSLFSGIVFYKGIKSKEYSFVILSSSLFMLAIKYIYYIYHINLSQFGQALISISITFISSGLIIIGSFIELYLYMYKTKILNNNLNIFYELVDKNNHNSMFLFKESGEILYANKKVREEYCNFRKDYCDLQTILINKGKSNIQYEEIKKSLFEKGFWKGILKNEKFNKIIDCYIQIIGEKENNKNIVVSYIDISDEINMELEIERLKVYDKEKSEFISNISHELRTPLNIFYSTIQLFDQFLDNNELDFKNIYNKYRKTLNLNCKRMMRLINNIIDVSKIDCGNIKPNFNNYNIVSIVEDVTLSVVRYALLKRINLHFDTNEEECFIKCDSSMIQRALLNILSNAIKFSKPNRNIYVNVFINDKFIEINVKDEGIGISKENQNIIFEKFIQSDKSFNRMNEGTGIGLSIVKSIVLLHNGHIEVESKLNEGSNFKVFLPNKFMEGKPFIIYDIDDSDIELELSDIYEVLT